MALESLRAIRPGREGHAQDTPAVTKSGVPLYGGDPLGLEDWMFLVQAKASARSRSKDKSVPLGPDLVEGLAGTALRVAKDLGLPAVEKDDGVETSSRR